MRKIVGMHVAGDPNGSGYAYASNVTIEEILRALAQYEDAVPTFNIFSNVRKVALSEGGMAQKQFNGNFKSGYMHKLHVYQPAKTKLVRTELYGTFGPSKYEPARLRPFMNEEGIRIDPMQKAVENYGGPNVDIDEDISWACARHWLVKFNSLTKHDTKEIFDFETAVQGRAGELFCDSVPRNTSAGFPYCVTLGSGKTKFFGKGQDFVFDSVECQLVRDQVFEIIENAKKGVRMENIFVDFLKDEKRKIEKVREGKTRLISACPLAYLIVVRMYTLAFSMALMKHRIHNGVAVGTNVYSDDWEIMALHLQSKGDNIFAGDFSSFDCSEQPQIHKSICRLINEWYDDGPENARIREVLFEDVYNSKHINGSYVYEWTHSLPSGHPLTSVINSLYNQIAFRYVYVILSGSVAGLKKFDDNVTVITYGDDNVVSVSDEVAEFFNQNTCIETMPDIGLKYTSEKKDETLVPNFRSLDGVSFLKRSFRYEPKLDRYVAPIELETIQELFNWKYYSEDSIGVTAQNVETALMELSLHGKQVFESIYPTVKQALRSKLDRFPEYEKWVDYLELAARNESIY